MSSACPIIVLFFFNDTAPPEIYTLSLHDALPIFLRPRGAVQGRSARARDHAERHAADADLWAHARRGPPRRGRALGRDRKSTRLNSSHQIISYAVFCLKKKKKQKQRNQHKSHGPL